MNKYIEKALDQMEEDRCLQQYYQFIGEDPILREMFFVNRRLDEIDLLMATNKLQPYEVEGLLIELRRLEDYYKYLEELNIKSNDRKLVK